MKRILTWTSILVLVILLVPANIAIKKYRLNHLDRKQVLAACRQAIADRDSYRNDKDKWGAPYEDDVLLLPPIPNEVPQALRDLHPSYILIREDSVLLTLKVPFARVSLLGFKSGARQYGTSRYIDGLWFWDGNDSTKSVQRR